LFGEYNSYFSRAPRALKIKQINSAISKVPDAPENFKKKVVQVWKIANFDRQPALFNGVSMGAIT
jgi:hypothetical protein